MPTTSIRTAAKARLVSLLQAHASLTGIQVTYGWPGRDVETEGVYVGSVSGTVETASMKTGRKNRDDTFTIEVHCAAFGHGQATCQAAEERAEVLYGAVEDTAAAYPTLNSLSGVTYCRQNGDVTYESGPTEEGWGAVITSRIEVLARLN